MAEYKNVENIRNLFDEEFKKTRQLIQQGETHLDNLAEGFLEADRVLLRIPTSDVVEVVRCKDCKHCCISTDPKTNISVQKCGYVGFNPIQSSQVSDDFYCSYGKRKDGSE